ncbi:hypothetical protein ACS0TY_015650 [Phlomoides rotata]
MRIGGLKEKVKLTYASEPDVSGQPTTSGEKEGEISLRPQKGPKPADTNTAGSHWFFNHAWEMLLKGMEFDTAHFITDVSGKYPRLWALKGAHPVIVNRWYKFGVLASIRTIAPGFREISELPDWMNKSYSIWKIICKELICTVSILFKSKSYALPA